MLVTLAHPRYVAQPVRLIEGRSEKAMIEFVKGPNKGRRLIIENEYIDNAC